MGRPETGGREGTQCAGFLLAVQHEPLFLKPPLTCLISFKSNTVPSKSMSSLYSIPGHILLYFKTEDIFPKSE